MSAGSTRPNPVIVTFTDHHGMRTRQTFEDLWATSVQHQIDHLNGMIYAGPPVRTKARHAAAPRAQGVLMRIVFMGTPDFFRPVLDALVEAGHQIACVYCQPPRPAGRGKKGPPQPGAETRRGAGPAGAPPGGA